MKMVASSRRHHYVARVSIIMIMVGLVAGMMGCDDNGAYDLTVFSTEGGSVTTPGEEILTYNKTTVVNLVAEPDDGYQFVKWTGDVGDLANVNAASTTIAMNGDYAITANFALEIWDWHSLDGIRDNLGGSYCLMNDLDFTTVNNTEGWQPIGTEAHPFTGAFYGQGYVIQNLFIDCPEESNVGLFGFVDTTGVIENIGLVRATVTGNYCVGALVGYNREGTVIDSYSTGSVKGYLRIGGLVGWNQGTVSTSYSAVHVTYARSVGGLVGYNTGTVSNSYSGGSATGFEYVGGLIGTNHVGGAVRNCYSGTTVTYELPPKGGLVGVNYMFLGGVRDSFWDTQTSGLDSSAGGTGKSTIEMKNADTFSSAGWNITTVANPDTRNPSSIWNIVDGETYPFLSWQSVS